MIMAGGIVVALAAFSWAASALGTHRWTRETQRLRRRIEAARSPIEPSRVDFRELEGLPIPVQRYFRRVLNEEAPMVSGVRVRHRGTFDMGAKKAQWKPFTSDQYVVTRRPGFDWNGRIGVMPGLSARVHDAYVAGEGVLHAALLGLFTVVDLRGFRDVAEGELMRFFAEAAWYPTALLPSQGVRWEAVDAHSARGTLVDGEVVLTMLFRFDQEGLIESVSANARSRRVGKRFVPTPWQGRFRDYAVRGDMRVPLQGEVAWLLPEGARPYWRGRIEEIRYEFAD
ncbi:DUF6920 family protein [Thiohalomonas denitrificans]|uniref:Uncharacterized protein n=1 Tax=Thiohalomonas denitrificans TaxID=415747 RepID=A0A1G5R1K2_9GAMM|nr:DUF6544 family protein [Thiohalomonas denitrificans]SCZ67932.1 hypothetical protein SAMN03097708_03231 [Thiohalomonas denitrificans]